MHVVHICYTVQACEIKIQLPNMNQGNENMNASGLNYLELGLVRVACIWLEFQLEKKYLPLAGVIRFECEHWVLGNGFWFPVSNLSCSFLLLHQYF